MSHKRRNPLVSRARVVELLRLGDDWNLYWRNPLRGHPQLFGQRAGTVTARGYMQIGIDGALYLSHRLVWLIFYGDWPKHTIDHINRDKLDNRIENLRDATLSVQNRNRCKYTRRRRIARPEIAERQ